MLYVLYEKEINDETYAICKSDMMMKSISSTLATDEFSGMYFDFMLSNPLYGKSWASKTKYVKDKNEVIDKRFLVKLKNYWGKKRS